MTFLYICEISHTVTVQCPKTISNLSNFRCRLTSGVGKMSIWTISTIQWGLSASVMVQCPKTMSNLSNLLRPIQLRNPNSANAVETDNAVMGTMGTILPMSAHCVIVSLCHWGSSERLLKCAIGAEFETANLRCCPIFMITVPWPLRELLWYFTSLQTKILTFISD